ncbi:MAG: FG-GAP repeat protein [Thermoanaerobaculia bacterium]|nr:FG-GAP repeat protein [Thermoanaerobaculia bacterium]
MLRSTRLVVDLFVVCTLSGSAWSGALEAGGFDAADGDFGLSTSAVGTRLTAFDPATAQNYGRRVAIDGNTVVIGDDIGENDFGVSTGAVYVYVYDGLDWTLQQKVTSADGVAGDNFGIAVSVAGDILAVGATGVDDVTSSFSESGAVYIYQRTGTFWSLEQKLLPFETRPDGLVPPFMEFGSAVAVDTSVPVGVPGDLAFTSVVVGVPNDQAVIPGCCTTRPGAISVFLRADTGQWGEKGYFVPVDSVDEAEFGASVAMDGDGIAVGSPGWRNASMTKVGAVYFFSRGGVQGNWGFANFQEASDGLSDDEFGQSVAIAATGGDYNLAVGAPGADLGQNESGAAYTYHGNTNLWTERKLTPVLAATNARFGNGVAVSEGVLVVGEPRSDLPRPNAGAAHVYLLGPALSWTLRETLEGTTIQPDVPLFGNQVGISDQWVVSGAPGEDVGAFLSAGAGWVFDLQLDIFADGFESGDTNAWTLAVPSP